MLYTRNKYFVYITGMCMYAKCVRKRKRYYITVRTPTDISEESRRFLSKSRVHFRSVSIDICSYTER